MKYKTPDEFELNGLAEDFVCPINEEELPLKEEDLDKDSLVEFLHDRGFELEEERISDFISYILSVSDSIYDHIKAEALSDFKDSLTRVIEEASDVLSDEEKMKIILTVSNEFYYI